MAISLDEKRKEKVKERPRNNGDYKVNTIPLALQKKAQARFPNANRGNIEPNMIALGDCVTSEDQKLMIIAMLGNMEFKHPLYNNVVVATFVTPQRSKGGIIFIDKKKDASRYESKVGLVISIGPTAFMMDRQSTYKYVGPEIRPGDWVWYRASDAPERWIKDVSCRTIEDNRLEGFVEDEPKDVF